MMRYLARCFSQSKRSSVCWMAWNRWLSRRMSVYAVRSLLVSWIVVAMSSRCCMSGFHQVALRLGSNGLWPQGLKEYSDSCSTSDYLGPVLGSKCLVTQTMGDYFGLGPSEETSEKMSQVATRTFNPLYCFPYMYTYWSHFSS
jgi:hypothetical protein